MSVKLVPWFQQQPEQRVRKEYKRRPKSCDTSWEGFQRFLPIPVEEFQELEMTCVFNSAESMSFHELGQHSFSGKDSTVKELLLLVCSLKRGRRAGVMGLVLLHYVQSFFKCKTVLETEFRVFFKDIAFPWMEESDLSFLFCC